MRKERNPFRVEDPKSTLPQGSRATRQPWALLRNRFAVEFSSPLNGVLRNFARERAGLALYGARPT